MARIVYPEDFNAQRTLLTHIKARHDADGTDSPLTAFLDQQGIDLAADATTGVAAEGHNVAHVEASRQAENFRQLRDNTFDPVFTRMKGSVQFLKSFYKGNERELGNWGITIDGKARVVYPPSFIERSELFQAFFTAYNGTPVTDSPLKPYLTQHNIVMSTEKSTTTVAIAYNTQFVNKGAESKNETEQRDNIWRPVMVHVRAIGDFLKKLYAGNERALYAWGFTVDEAIKAPKLRVTSLEIGGQTTNSGVIIGGTFTNIGTGELHLFKGKDISGTPQTVHPGESVGMLKGYSTITVVNPNTLTAGKFQVLSSDTH